MNFKTVDYDFVYPDEIVNLADSLDNIMYRPSGFIGNSTYYDAKFMDNGKMDFRGCSR